MTENGFWFPPLEDGARVITDVIAAAALSRVDIGETVRAVVDPRKPHTVGTTDVVLVAVPAGEGVAVECAIRRALRVEGQDA